MKNLFAFDKFKFAYSILFFIVCALPSPSDGVASKARRILPTIFGEIVIENQVIADLLDSKIMQRLKHIDQSGTPYYFRSHIPSYTRYNHSIGVFALLKMKGAPLNEMIAGLLHDTSHTVFSHTGDWVVGQADQEEAYQDNIHAWYLKKMGAADILKAHNIPIKDILHKNNGHIRLEQKLPDMCADRIEYNLHTALIFGMLTRAEIKKIVNDLKFEKGKWFFSHPLLAKKFARLSLYFTEYFWGAPFNQVINRWSGHMMKRAFEIGLLTPDDFHFGQDEEVLSKLKNSNDPMIRELLYKCQNPQDFYEVVEEEPCDFETKPKFRGIDPLVKVKEKLVRLTEIDDEFRREYNRVKSLVTRGIKIRL